MCWDVFFVASTSAFCFAGGIIYLRKLLLKAVYDFPDCYNDSSEGSGLPQIGAILARLGNL